MISTATSLPPSTTSVTSYSVTNNEEDEVEFA